MTAQNEKNLLSVGAVSKKLGVSISTLRRWDNAGKLRSLRTPGNQRRYSQAQIESFLKGNKGDIEEDKGNITGHPDPATAIEGSPTSYQLKVYPVPTGTGATSSFDPHHLLYAVIAAIVTVQLLHLAILKISQFQASMDTVTSTILGLSQRTPEQQDLNRKTQESNHPVLSRQSAASAASSSSRVLISAFLKSALYTGNHYFRVFSAKLDYASVSGTYALAQTSNLGIKTLAHSIADQMLASRATLFPETEASSTILAQTPSQSAILGVDKETNQTEQSLNAQTIPTQEVSYGSILIDPYQRKVSIDFRTSERVDSPPKSIIATPSYLTQVALTELNPEGFTVTLSEASSEHQILYWVALW